MHWNTSQQLFLLLTTLLADVLVDLVIIKELGMEKKSPTTISANLKSTVKYIVVEVFQ